MSLLERVAGAPISWGACEVPGWGYQLSAGRVLAEMRAAGLAATEFGPERFLADEPKAKAEQLAAAGLQAVGGFMPVVLHEPAFDPLPAIDRALDAYAATGAGVIVLAAATGAGDYDHRPPLDSDGWSALCANLDRIAERAAERGVTAALHPHVGTMVEREDEVYRVMDATRVMLCIDTGHLLIGGADPVALVRAMAPRVGHVHLKDVDSTWAARVRSGASTYSEAVAHGIYRPLGEGGADIRGLVNALEAADYGGWYVIEQDRILTGEPREDGPIADVRTSLQFLSGVAACLT